jgi:hypothetical protein
MTRTICASLLVLVVALCACAGSEPAKPPPATPAGDTGVAAATAAAQAWLALIDARRYGESWSAASKTFQGAISRDAWSRSVETVRSPLGDVVSRQIKSARPETSLPGVPDGSFVVIEYATAFARKPGAVETVTPMQEADGSWKVGGYFVK